MSHIFYIKKILFSFLVFLLLPLLTMAQSDTVWVNNQGKQLYVQHIVKSGETLFMLAARFHAPAAATAHLNEMSYQEGLQEGRVFKIPIGKFNYLRINSVLNSHAIYYKVQDGQRLRFISRLFHVSQSTIQRWNKLPMPEVFAGQSLLVGWLQFDSVQVPFPEKPKEEEPVLKKDKLTTTTNENKNVVTDSSQQNKAMAEISALGQEFHQINKDKELQEISGATVFFTINSKGKHGVYYAFFNNAARGTILSIYNPSSKKVIYAKVIGPLPKISKYHNAVVGLSANAAKELRARGARIFCKIKY